MSLYCPSSMESVRPLNSRLDTKVIVAMITMDAMMSAAGALRRKVMMPPKVRAPRAGCAILATAAGVRIAARR